MTELPLVIDIRITSECNLRCPFCFGPEHQPEAHPLSRETIVDLLGRFRAHGVTAVVFTGGEPLMVPHFPLVLRQAKQLGLMTVVSTNGLFLTDHIDELAPSMDWLALPLDADGPDVSSRLRLGASNQFAEALRAYGHIRNHYPNIRVKIQTVVCSLNLAHVRGIPRLLGQVGPPDMWKLYQLAYSGRAKANRELLYISDREFASVVSSARQEAAAFGIRTAVFERATRDRRYLFMEPNGDAMAIVGGEEVVIGNFVSDFGAVLGEWRAFADPDSIARNLRESYLTG